MTPAELLNKLKGHARATVVQIEPPWCREAVDCVVALMADAAKPHSIPVSRTPLVNASQAADVGASATNGATAREEPAPDVSTRLEARVDDYVRLVETLREQLAGAEADREMLLAERDAAVERAKVAMDEEVRWATKYNAARDEADELRGEVARLRRVGVDVTTAVVECVRVEREACAQVAMDELFIEGAGCGTYNDACEDIAAAIRARGKP